MANVFKTSSRLLVFALGLLILQNLPAWAETQPTVAVQQGALRQVFEEAKLGPAEEKVFEAEALPEAGLFVLDYKNSADGADVQVDAIKLKNFVRFSSNQFSRQGLPSRVCVAARPAASCAACQALQKKIEESLITRFRQRGFTTKSASNVLDESALSGERAFEDYIGRAGEVQCTAFAYAEILPDHDAGQDDEDQEIQLRTVAYFLGRDASGKKVKSRGQSIIQVPHALGSDDAKLAEELARMATSRQCADLFAQAAGQVKDGGLLDAGRAERYLRLENLTSFEAYVRFKQDSQAAMPDLKLEERLISPGVIQFAVSTESGLSDLAARLKEEGVKARALSATEGELVMELF